MSDRPLTYGKRGYALSARNAAIIAARTTPQRALPTQHAPHPRDLRLAKLRAAQSHAEWQEARQVSEQHGVAANEPVDSRNDRLLAYLEALATDGAPMPTNPEIADRLHITTDQVNSSLSSLVTQGRIKRVSNRHWRVIEIAETGALLRSVGAPAEAVPV